MVEESLLIVLKFYSFFLVFSFREFNKSEASKKVSAENNNSNNGKGSGNGNGKGNGNKEENDDENDNGEEYISINDIKDKETLERAVNLMLKNL